MKYYIKRVRLRRLERRVIEAAKRACGAFATYDELNNAEEHLRFAVRDLEKFERKNESES
jgi:hypothetical protein